jgi:sialate O-acetylesterase
MQNQIFKKIRILFIMLLLFPATMKATDWSCVVNLSGSWFFSVGDNSAWANPKTDVSDWDKLYVPGAWEDYYNDYDGYAWYRKNFDMRPYPENGKLSLLLGRIDDVDEVFINGIKVGQTGSFFPEYQTAYDRYRRYDLPEGLLKPTGNVIAVRVFDEGLGGGIISGDEIGIYYDNDVALLLLDLSGDWRFSPYRESGITEKNFNDKNWKSIKVPQHWENQGYPNLDGRAWYRKEFSVPADLIEQDLFLSLGRIDDMDKVYLNVKLIGRTEDLDTYNRYNKWNAHRLYRIYRIPNELLGTKNVLAVEVYDGQQAGGIYEGPIGLVTRKNAYILEDRNEDENWSFPLRGVFESIFNW